MSEKVKTVSLHYKRRRADVVCRALNELLRDLYKNPSRAPVAMRLDGHGLPGWTKEFEARRARTRFHYRVVALS